MNERVIISASYDHDRHALGRAWTTRAERGSAVGSRGQSTATDTRRIASQVRRSLQP